MSTKIIVSYDGTANEDDAIALGASFGRAGAEVSLAYVRHTHEADSDREKLAQAEAEELLDARRRAARRPRRAERSRRHRPLDPARACAALAEREGADVIVFCSDSHTAKGHVARRQLRPAPARGRHAPRSRSPRPASPSARGAAVQQIVAVGDADGGARDDRRGSRRRRSERRSRRSPTTSADLLVVDSRAEAEQGQVSLSSSAVAPDRDRHLPGARGAARRDASRFAARPPRSPSAA